ncbi:protein DETOXIFICATION 16-like isoform X2 [Cucurbita pepo subsp. pepo]|uniref:protein DETOXIFICATION 16-like isoform X2 n=1 Tax=Cucurbita pepo subsp. pepo TaxID=3664 RepID=UPI000C9D7F1B|nr:protein DETOXIFICATION 16-like isoform X2 [Cucurbita pepo subsp. pepo]
MMDIQGGEVLNEVKRQLLLAGPLFSIGLLQYSLQIISLMFVGHLGELALAAASMATSFVSVTGFSLLMGMASALDTLCGQSFGAKRYHMLGLHTQCAMFVLLVVSIFLVIITSNTKMILIALHQDQDISKGAGLYARYMIPSVVAYGQLQCLVKFLQTQNIVFPMVLSSGIAALIHILLCWILVFEFELRIRGTALANSISYWINVCLIALYVKISSCCSETWTGFTVDALHNVLAFLRISVPSALMLCLKVWTFEMVVILSGLLPNPKLETSVLSICLNIFGLFWMISFGLSAAVSIRVSNELGAGRPRAARMAAYVALVMVVVEGVLVGVLMVLLRDVWGRVYSEEEEVVRYLATMMPTVAVSSFFDGVQSVLSGVARGCGWQKMGAYINLASFYLVGIPCSITLAFVLDMKGKGLWLGVVSAFLVQVVFFLGITVRTNWDKQAEEASNRGRDYTVPLYVEQD